jgi:hypothetical protein
MKAQITDHLSDPHQLEKLYRNNKAAFKSEFGQLYPQVKGQPLADFWHERLNYESDKVQWGSQSDLAFVIIASLIAACIAKIPVWFSLDQDVFFPRNVGFIVFPLLAAFFVRKNRLSVANIAIIVVAMLAGSVFINLLPRSTKSDTLVLSCIHLLLFLWATLGCAYIGGTRNDTDKRLGFLKYNGDLVVMCALILIAGGIMTAVTIGLFSLIGLHIEKWYGEYIVVSGLAAAPIVGTYLTQTNPQLVGKVSPVIARLFAPLVLVMLVAYLVAICYSGKSPYTDREFLLIFNALLIGVMAIIFFSVAEGVNTIANKFAVWVLFLLSVVTIVINGIALSAILFRIAEWGFTPNRAAVLGGNLLILIHLLLVMVKLFKAIRNKGDIAGVGQTIVTYLPVYVVWTVVVTFGFPFLFGFK